MSNTCFYLWAEGATGSDKLDSSLQNYPALRTSLFNYSKYLIYSLNVPNYRIFEFILDNATFEFDDELLYVLMVRMIGSGQLNRISSMKIRHPRVMELSYSCTSIYFGCAPYVPLENMRWIIETFDLFDLEKAIEQFERTWGSEDAVVKYLKNVLNEDPSKGHRGG